MAGPLSGNIMALQPTDGENKVFYNDATNQYHLVNIDPSDGSQTDLGVISQADQVAAIESLETSLLARNQIDAVTNSRLTIDYPHHEVHDGRSYHISDVQNVSSTTEKWLITTPDSPRLSHMVFDIRATGEMQVTITAGADRTGSDAVTIINRRQVSPPNVAGTTVHRGVVVPSPDTGTDGATQIDAFRVGATEAGSRTVAAGESRGSSEFVLKRNTKYVVAVLTFANIYVTAHFDWYEHIDAA